MLLAGEKVYLVIEDHTLAFFLDGSWYYKVKGKPKTYQKGTIVEGRFVKDHGTVVF